MASPEDEIERRFAFHPADEDTGEAHDYVRAAHGDLAFRMLYHLPEGREKSVVFTKLEESMYWANAAIAREGK